MHEQTTSSQRSTTVSATSLALMLGGLLGNLLHPRLAEASATRPRSCGGRGACCSSPWSRSACGARRAGDAGPGAAQASNAVG